MDSVLSPVKTQNSLQTDQAWREHCQEQSGKFKWLQGVWTTRSTENRAGYGAWKDSCGRCGADCTDREIVKCTKVLQHKHLDQLLLITLAESVTQRCPPRGDQVLQTYKKQWGEPTRAPKTPWKTSKKNLVIRASRRMECLSLSVYCSSDGHCIRFD